MSKLLGVLVLLALVYVFVLDDEPALTEPEPTATQRGETDVDVPEPLTVAGAPEVVAPVSETATVEPTPQAVEPRATRSPWTVRWSLADEFGDALEYTQLTRLGVFDSMLPTGHLTVTDAAGADEREIELQDFKAEGFFSTTRRSPIDIVLRFGDVSFAGKAAASSAEPLSIPPSEKTPAVV